MWDTCKYNLSIKIIRQNGRALFCTAQLHSTAVNAQRNFVADFIRLKLQVIQKTQKSLFEPPIGQLMGNVRTPSTARWKARGRLPIRHNGTVFAISYS